MRLFRILSEYYFCSDCCLSLIPPFMIYYIYLEYGLMPASNIYTYIHWETFWLYYRYTCDLYYFHCIMQNPPPPLHRDTSSLRSPRPSSLLLFDFSVRRYFPHYNLCHQENEAVTQNFLFLYPQTPKLSQTFIASNANAIIKQETTQSKAKKHIFWFPPFGMKKTLSISLLLHFCQNLTQKGHHSHTKKIIPGHSVLVRLAFFLSPYHFYDVCSDLTLLYLKFLLSATSTVPTPTPLNHFP